MLECNNVHAFINVRPVWMGSWENGKENRIDGKYISKIAPWWHIKARCYTGDIFLLAT